MSTIGYYICVPFAWLVRLFYNLTNSYGVAHAHHALLGLHLEGQHNQLDHQGEQDDCRAIGTGQLIKKADQPRKRDTDIVSDG